MSFGNVVDPDLIYKVWSLVIRHLEVGDLARLMKTSTTMRIAATVHPAYNLLRRKRAALAVPSLGILGAAVQFGDVAALKWVCRDQPVSELESPLRLAASLDLPACIEVLVACGADVDLGEEDTALIIASGRGHESSVLALIEARATVDAQADGSLRTALAHAAAGGSVACVSALIRAGASLEMRSWEDIGNEEYREECTAIMLAARNRHGGCVRALIQAQADVNATDECECTALIHACQHGHEGYARALLEARADVEATDTTDGYTALMLASRYGHEGCARALLEARANVEAIDATDGYTALTLASQYGHEGCTRALTEARANVDATWKHGYTALMFASRNGNEPCVRALLGARADVHATTTLGRTALMLASRAVRPGFDRGASGCACHNNGWPNGADDHFLPWSRAVRPGSP
jgi:ankyrin repeat protein